MKQLILILAILAFSSGAWAISNPLKHPSNIQSVDSITSEGTISATNANSGAILNEASTSTNPSLVADKTDETSGLCDNGTGTQGIVAGGLTTIMTNDKGSWTYSQFFGNTLADGEWVSTSDEMFEFTGTVNDTTTAASGDFSLVRYNLIGTDTTAYATVSVFDIVGTITTDGTNYGTKSTLTYAGATSATQQPISMSNALELDGSNYGASSEAVGLLNNVRVNGSAGSATLDMYSVKNQISVVVGSTLTGNDLYTGYFIAGNQIAGGATIVADNAYSIYVADPTITTYTVPNLYGLYVEELTKGSALNYGIFTHNITGMEADDFAGTPVAPTRVTNNWSHTKSCAEGVTCFILPDPTTHGKVECFVSATDPESAWCVALVREDGSVIMVEDGSGTDGSASQACSTTENNDTTLNIFDNGANAAVEWRGTGEEDVTCYMVYD